MEIEDRKFLFEFHHDSDKERILNKQPWLILGNTLLIQEITEDNFMDDIDPSLLPIQVTLSSLPVDYASWQDIKGITNLVGQEDRGTPFGGHIRRNLGYNLKIWFSSKSSLPTAVPVTTISGREALVKFIFENVPSNFCYSCFTIKHDTATCPRSRLTNSNNISSNLLYLNRTYHQPLTHDHTRNEPQLPFEARLLNNNPTVNECNISVTPAILSRTTYRQGGMLTGSNVLIQIRQLHHPKPKQTLTTI